MASNTKARRRLFAADPHCHWCGKLTRIDARPGAADEATVDHVFDRVETRTLGAQGPRPKVLACYGCNKRRNKMTCTARSAAQYEQMA